MARITKPLYHCIRFAKFAMLHKLDPNHLATLIALKTSARVQGIKHSNGADNTKALDKARRNFENQAKSLGFDTEWNSNSPTLRKDGQDVFMPE